MWRRKDGFSDGVSCHEKPLYSQIDEFTQNTKGMSEKDIMNPYFKPITKAMNLQYRINGYRNGVEISKIHPIVSFWTRLVRKINF